MADGEAWKRMVLRSMPPPAWLAADAPNGDVVLSSRVRIMRNVRGIKFVHTSTDGELRRVMEMVLEAAQRTDLDLEVFKGLTNAERDYLVGCRLVSPDFEWTLPGRALLVDRTRTVSVMVNEEDHLRVQVVTAGWSIPNAESLARHTIRQFGDGLEFAFSPRFGYLSASPINLRDGQRISAMFHLIGLAQGKRLPAVLRALTSRGIVVRGLFGEASRAIGAFAQVSAIGIPRDEYVGACDYLLKEEREARAEVSRDRLAEKATQARDFAVSSRMMSLADSLRVLAWVRWAASSEIEGFTIRPRAIDAALTTLEIRGTSKEEYAARERADHLRHALSA